MAFVEFKLREITPAFVRNLLLKDEDVLNGLCKAIGIGLTVNRSAMVEGVLGPHYVVTPKGSPCFGGTIHDVACYVHGYASAWAEARSRELSNIDSRIYELKKYREACEDLP